MSKTRTRIYAKITPEKNEVVYSGIEFAEFIKYLFIPIENLMLITGGSNVVSLETTFERRLELFEGHKLIDKLAKRDIYHFGDFCFVDYELPYRRSELSEQQIAELLYMGHMFKPLQTPFFEPLQNRFAYLSQDDGWYCKLYCRELDEFMAVLSGKITSSINVPLPAVIQNRLKQTAMGGLLIDLEEIRGAKNGANLKIYTVGAHSNMDEVLNNWQQIKSNATLTNTLSYSNNEWSIS